MKLPDKFIKINTKNVRCLERGYLPTLDDVNYFKNKMLRDPNNKKWKQQYDLIKDAVIISKIVRVPPRRHFLAEGWRLELQ